VSNQGSLFRFQRYPDEPGCKVMGPSEAAALSMTPLAKTLQSECLAVLRGAPMTADEVAERLGATPFAIRPRLTELRRLGLVHDSGLRRANASRRGATVWALTR
jgi:predicted ArsR family transcriptional regulator